MDIFVEEKEQKEKEEYASEECIGKNFFFQNTNIMINYFHYC
jgi:hypothetical protein